MNLKEGQTLNRRDIEAKLANVGDYVKMDYLSACLKKGLDFDTKKYVLNKLAAIYESRGMFAEAARLMRNSADINATFDGKMNDFMRSSELFIKGMVYDESDASFGKALALGNQRQKEELKAKRKTIIKLQAQDMLKKDKRKHAMMAFEKYLSLDLSAQERKEAQIILMGLYEKLGKIREFYSLKKLYENPSSAPQPKPQPVDKDNGPSIDELLGID